MAARLPYTFGGIPDLPLKDARFVVFPVPYEATVSYQTGAKFGPEGIILASRNMELYDEELDIEPYTAGIKTVAAVETDQSGPEQMTRRIEQAAGALAGQGKLIAALGGEHSISPGIVRALRRIHHDMNVIHLDAHADVQDSYDGTPFSHACPVRRMLDTGCAVKSFGTRSISREEMDFIKKEKPALTNVWAHKMAPGWPAEEARKIPGGRYYLSIDIDFFDPAAVPDTGTPEPGGFFWQETTAFLKNVLTRKDIEVVGFDLVELAPKNLLSPSCFFAAKLVYKILGCLAAKG